MGGRSRRAPSRGRAPRLSFACRCCRPGPWRRRLLPSGGPSGRLNGWHEQEMVKLLVADDEQKICRLLETFFSERGFEVLLAHDGASALETIRRERPHLVFLDLRMPGLNSLA